MAAVAGFAEWKEERVLGARCIISAFVRPVALKVCVCVCMCMYIHTFIHTYKHTYIQTYIRMIHTYMHTYITRKHKHTHTQDPEWEETVVFYMSDFTPEERGFTQQRGRHGRGGAASVGLWLRQTLLRSLCC